MRGLDRVLACPWHACVPASAGVTLVTAPTSRLARMCIMRPALGDSCWAAVMAHANSWLELELELELEQCAVSGESRAARSRDVATGMCGVWINKARGAGAEASGQ